MTTPRIDRDEAYDAASMGDASALLAMIKNVNGERENPDAGIVWWLYAGERPGRMVAGVRGAVGVLTWSDPTDSYLPENGVNSEYVDYFTWGGHHFTQRPGAEVPIELVCRAVTEYVDTQDRPTCVTWTRFFRYGNHVTTRHHATGLRLDRATGGPSLVASRCWSGGGEGWA